MAYNGPLQVIQFTPPEVFVSVATAGMDLSVDPSGADHGTLAIPVNFMLYQFGVYISQNLGTAVTGSVFLERSTNVAGSDTTVAEIDFQSTSLSSGDDLLPRVTALAASNDIDGGDVVYAARSIFPFLVVAPQILTVRYEQSATNGEGEATAFVIGRWQAIDARGTEFWTDVN